MTPATTLGAYAAALALVFAGAVGVGRAVGPVGTASAGQGAADHGGGHAGEAVGAGLPPGGLAVTQDGYALQLARTTMTPGRPGTLQFAIAGPDGERLTSFTRVHDKDLHLIVVRRDLTGFQHLHPTRDRTGRWAVPVTLDQPGSYKVIADFTPQGREDPLALAADLTAPGSSSPVPLPAPAARAAVDGYEVQVDGELVAGRSSRLVLTVSKDGRPVTDLEPYLGAYGHLVALRAGDLAYLHTHPEDGPAGPEVVFDADVPAAGTHRLFLDFQHGGVVRTAAFTVEAVRSTEHGEDHT